MKLSIVIVNWNVRDHLRDCLASIFKYPPKDSFEVFVVDNASSDGSADMVRQEYPQVNLIINVENKGFGTANNQGIRQAKGEYVLVFNDDAQVKEGSLDIMINYLDTHSDVGVVGPKILNVDGSLQPSVRRFPDFLSQWLASLKVQFLFPKLKVFRKYLAADFDYKKEQDVQQIMGACMMIRKKVLDQIGLFDEKFFIWFEEVDLLKRIADAGIQIVYTPTTEIIHVGGASFAQAESMTKHRMFSASCRRYIYKHKGIFAWLAILAVYPLGTLFVWLKNQKLILQSNKGIHLPFWLWSFLTIMAVEVLSFVGWSTPAANDVMFWVIGIVTFILGLYRLEYAVMIALAELVIGSKGGLFSFVIGSHEINVRIIIFTALAIAWVLRYCAAGISAKTLLPEGFLVIRHSLFRWWYAAMGALILAGTVYGLMRNTPGLVFADANAWYYFFIAPIVYDALSKKGVLSRVARLTSVAIAAQLTKTFFLIYAMSHPGIGYEITIALYRWVRDTGVGEVTMVSQNVYRTFLQSQIYLLPFFLGILAYLRWGSEGKPSYASKYTGRAIWAGGFVCAGIIVGQSRSFWVALAFAGLFLAMMGLRRSMVRGYGAWVGKGVLIVLCSLLIIISVIRFPFPSTSADLGLNSVSGRFANEAAVGSRWSLLPVMAHEITKSPLIGFGYGKTLTYNSQDPRILENNPTGEYTTYAFEWGYLEILLKVGIVGFALYGAFLGYVLFIGWRAISNIQKNNNGMAYAWTVGLWLGLITVIVTHFFTPYLNHPLGIAYIVVASFVFERMYPRANSSPDMTLFPSG